jgi:(p)ppGpp synthase/HD superfamily hydrolase
MSNSPWSTLSQALRFAFHYHEKETRSDTNSPYVSHVLAVVSLILEHGGDEDLAVAAALQAPGIDQDKDVMANILTQFGPWTASIVVACQASYPHSVDDIVKITKQHTDVHLILCAELLHTARLVCMDLRTSGLKRFGGMEDVRRATLWYYATLEDCFRSLVPGTMPTEFRAAVQEMRQLANRLAGSDYLSSLDVMDVLVDEEDEQTTDGQKPN